MEYRDPKGGDFVKISLENGKTLHGVLGYYKIPPNPSVNIMVYDAGLPFDFPKIEAEFPMMPGHVPDCPNVAEIISQDDYINHLEESKERFSKKLASKGLVAACWASRMYSLDDVIGHVKDSGDIPFTFLPATPSTGIYVVHALAKPTNRPISCSEAPEDQPLQGIKVNPVLSPYNLAFVLSYTNPRGFGAVDAGTYQSSPGVSRFFAYSIPEEAVGYVKNPLEFDFTPREAAAKKAPAKKSADKKPAAKKKAKKKAKKAKR